MLVLSRKVDQDIMIDGKIKIRVLKIKGNTIRLGIEAPADVHIARGELEKKDSREATNIPEAEDLQANFTIVFDTNEQTGKPAKDNRPALLPFDKPAKSNRLNGLDDLRNASSQTDSSVEFKGKLPGAFQRNRLKEIVDRMTCNRG